MAAVCDDGTLNVRQVQAYAADALGELGRYDQNSDVIRREGGIQALIAVLRDGSPEVQEQAARALGWNGQNADVIRQLPRECLRWRVAEPRVVRSGRELLDAIDEGTRDPVALRSSATGADRS